MSYQKGYIAFLIVLTVGCLDKPHSYEAVVSEAIEVDKTGLTGIKFETNIEKSYVTWVGTKPTGRHMGTFKLNKGIVLVNEQSLIGGTFHINIASVDVTDLNGDIRDKLIQHLKSPDFFDLQQFPEAIFEISNVAPWTDSPLQDEDTQYFIENPTHLVRGNFTMRGITLGITFPARIELQEQFLIADGMFNIDRTMWDVNWGSDQDLISKLRDQFAHPVVNVGFHIEASAGTSL